MVCATIWIVSPSRFQFNNVADEVALALLSALLSNGMNANIVRDPREIDGVPILLMAQLIDMLDYEVELPKNAIIFNLEQIFEDSPWTNIHYLDMLRKHIVWDYSLRNIAELKKMGVNNIHHLPIGYAPELANMPVMEEDLDVIFIGSMNERRLKILDNIEAKGLSIAYLRPLVNANELQGIFGEERNEAIARAKIVLNIHFYEKKLFQIVRVSHLLANKKFVISEIGEDKEYEEKFKTGLVFGGAEDIPNLCVQYVNDDKTRKAIAHKGFEIFSNMKQADFIKPLLHQIQTK